MVCDICGNPIKTGAAYCEKCGCYIQNTGALIREQDGNPNVFKMGMFGKVFAFDEKEKNPLINKKPDQLISEMIDVYFEKNGFKKNDKIESISKRKSRIFI